MHHMHCVLGVSSPPCLPCCLLSPIPSSLSPVSDAGRLDDWTAMSYIKSTFRLNTQRQLVGDRGKQSLFVSLWYRQDSDDLLPILFLEMDEKNVYFIFLNATNHISNVSNNIKKSKGRK